MHTRAVIIKCILPITCRLNTWFMESDSRRSFMNGALKYSLFRHINLLLKRNCFCQCNYRLERKKWGANSSTYSICYDWNNQGLTAWQLSIGVWLGCHDLWCQLCLYNKLFYSQWLGDWFCTHEQWLCSWNKGPRARKMNPQFTKNILVKGY